MLYPSRPLKLVFETSALTREVYFGFSCIAVRPSGWQDQGGHTWDSWIVWVERAFWNTIVMPSWNIFPQRRVAETAFSIILYFLELSERRIFSASNWNSPTICVIAYPVVVHTAKPRWWIPLMAGLVHCRLATGVLQLAAGTHLTLDLTSMTEGKLNTTGVENLSTLRKMMQFQTVCKQQPFFHIFWATAVMYVAQLWPSEKCSDCTR